MSSYVFGTTGARVAARASPRPSARARSPILGYSSRTIAPHDPDGVTIAS